MVLLDLAERFPDRLRHLVRLTRTVSRFGNFTNRTRLIIRHKLERNLSEVTLGPNSTKCSGFAPLLLGSTQTHQNRFRNRLHHVLRVSIKRALSDDSTGRSRSSSSRLHVPLLKSFRVSAHSLQTKGFRQANLTRTRLFFKLFYPLTHFKLTRYRLSMPSPLLAQLKHLLTFQVKKQVNRTY